MEVPELVSGFKADTCEFVVEPGGTPPVAGGCCEFTVSIPARSVPAPDRADVPPPGVPAPEPPGPSSIGKPYCPMALATAAESFPVRSPPGARLPGPPPAGSSSGRTTPGCFPPAPPGTIPGARPIGRDPACLWPSARFSLPPASPAPWSPPWLRNGLSDGSSPDSPGVTPVPPPGRVPLEDDRERFPCA